MRASRGMLAVSACIAVAVPIVVVNLAGAAIHPRAKVPYVVTTAASPEAVKAGASVPISLRVTVMKNKSPDANVKVYLNVNDLMTEAAQGFCSPAFANAVKSSGSQGLVGVTNTKGQLLLNPAKYRYTAIASRARFRLPVR